MAEKENKNGSIHDGHRQRMKERFQRGGLDSFSDHEILEFLLFYAVPYRDTNPIAHTLVDRYGSWVKVVDASYDDLLTVSGVTPHMATLLTLTGKMAQRYYRDQTGMVQHLYNLQEVTKHVTPFFMGEREEMVLLVSLDNKRKHLNTTCLFRGSVNSTQFNIRMAVEQALRDNATQVVLAHNHPNGFAFPSKTDIRTTQYVMEVLRPLDIQVIEHVIVADGDCLCMSVLPDTKWLFDGSEPPAYMQVADNDVIVP